MAHVGAPESVALRLRRGTDMGMRQHVGVACSHTHRSTRTPNTATATPTTAATTTIITTTGSTGARMIPSPRRRHCNRNKMKAQVRG